MNDKISSNLKVGDLVEIVNTDKSFSPEFFHRKKGRILAIIASFPNILIEFFNYKTIFSDSQQDWLHRGNNFHHHSFKNCRYFYGTELKKISFLKNKIAKIKKLIS